MKTSSEENYCMSSICHFHHVSGGNILTFDHCLEVFRATFERNARLTKSRFLVILMHVAINRAVGVIIWDLIVIIHALKAPYDPFTFHRAFVEISSHRAFSKFGLVYCKGRM